MADFVENEPKYVMLIVPHHPPRLAQLSGVFVAYSTKTAYLLVRMSHQATKRAPVVVASGFIEMLYVFIYGTLFLAQKQSSYPTTLHWQGGCEAMNILTFLGCSGSLLMYETEYYSKKLQGELVRCFEKYNFGFMLSFIHCFWLPSMVASSNCLSSER